MALKRDEVIQILNESKEIPIWVKEAREYSKTLKALVEGKEFKNELSRIEHIEKSEDKWKAREKYSRSIKDLNKRILEPIDNVYTSTGGSKHYDTGNDDMNAVLIEEVRKNRGNQSLEKWLQNNWKKVYHTDPQGIIWTTTSKNDPTRSYAVYKSINVIRNYKDNGQNLYWIVFEPKNIDDETGKYQLWRLVDDSKDWRFKKEGDTFTEITEGEFATIEHPFGMCPGIINSDIVEVGCMKRLSPIDEIVEVQQEYLRDQSILTIVKFLNGFQNLVRPKVICPTCHGVKKADNSKCKDCDGKGFLINKDVTDEIILPIDPRNPDISIPNANTLAAWIGLDVETWDQYRKELELIAIICQETHWGSHQTKQSDRERTATEIWVNTQPVINALNRYSDVAEFMEWQITEFKANALFPNKQKNKKVSSITYGRRYILDTPDQLLSKYTESKKEQLATTILDKQLNEVITAKYKNDPIELFIQLIKIEVEPWPHYTLEQVNEVFGREAAQIKAMFGEWWETLDLDGIEAEKAKKSFKEWTKNKLNESRNTQTETTLSNGEASNGQG